MFSSRTFFVFVGGVALLAIFAWGTGILRAYETAEYEVIEKDRSFEIREYPDLMMATTTMNTSLQGRDGSFMRLFRYISGSNDKQQKVAMTTPVFMGNDSQEKRGQMGFVIPVEVAKGQIPEPADEAVAIRKRAAGRFAVIRFAGVLNRELAKEAEGELRAWMNENNLAGEEEFEYAGYDPPWTPGSMRRNEVLIRLKSEE